MKYFREDEFKRELCFNLDVNDTLPHELNVFWLGMLQNLYHHLIIILEPNESLMWSEANGHKYMISDISCYFNNLFLTFIVKNIL